MSNEYYHTHFSPAPEMPRSAQEFLFWGRICISPTSFHPSFQESPGKDRRVGKYDYYQRGIAVGQTQLQGSSSTWTLGRRLNGKVFIRIMVGPTYRFFLGSRSFKSLLMFGAPIECNYCYQLHIKVKVRTHFLTKSL